MCGIAGIVSNSKIDIIRLEEMKDSLKHRGPDDSGIVLIDFSKQIYDQYNKQYFNNENMSHYTCGLAHTRLSILDLSYSGHQPMSNSSKTLWITYNGEVYNFLEIRKKLIELGYEFYTNTDTEVVLKAYENWGEKCLQLFNGMFAFAIFDNRNPKKPLLFIARDRVGKKPFYYYKSNDKFYFASELKAITKGVGKTFSLNYNMLNYYLAFGYCNEDQCIFKDIFKLPPGHSGFYDINNNKLKINQYWALPFPEEDNEKYCINDLVDELESLLEDSVKMRMISDVPLGIFLSGGIDSSLIAAMASKCSSEPIKTFTISFPKSKYDESIYAKKVANFVNSNSYILSGLTNIFDTIDEFSNKIDDPLADSSLLPTYLVSKLTRKHVTVALGGDGGDELFGGYGHYLIKKQNYCFMNILVNIIDKLTTKLPAGFKGRNKLFSLTKPYLEQNIWATPYYDIHLRKRLLKINALNNLDLPIDWPEKSKLEKLNMGKNDIDKLTRLDFLTYLPEDIMAKVDRASMACSLEVRTPWLDYRIIEFAFKKVHYNYKIFNNQTRILQKKLANRLLPNILKLERKQGFSVPIDKWLRDQEGARWSNLLIDCLNPNEFNKEFIKNELIKGEMKNRANGARIWALGMIHYALKNQESC